MNSKASLALELGRAVIEMRSRSRQFIQARIKENQLNITYEMLEVLMCLWEKDGINQQEIADRIIKEKASMTYLLDNLVKRDLVNRMPDGNDRRNNLIHLTKQGKDLQEKLLPWAMEMYTAASIDLTEEDIIASTLLIKQLTKNIQ
ncbi:MarR family winged helix-turn-helix transcriptional regulator [Pedobacter panaciterrae]|jgi:Transcriptional regulators|uniref:MarR family transcriptional regulator n=1 Tax=Pedobacter panaciterrae TaxID=363849 RepID=A0ABU8NLM6_9SPHI|nr:MarR family transcriptional regulator [Pedobacter panaciterrae]NQX52744.1 MarR family transcriptional regulator [Pedobacter panaciterrae]